MNKWIMMLLLGVSTLLGSVEQEITSVTKSIGSEEKFASLYYKRAKLYCEADAYEKAIEDFRRALVFKPDYKDTQLQIARAYIEDKQPEPALALCTSSLEGLSGEPVRAFQLAQADALFLQQNFKDGIRLYERHKDSLSIDELSKLATAYFEDGDGRKAISMLKDALREHPHDYALSKKMVELSTADGSYTLANSLIERMLKNKQMQAQTYYLQAQIYEAEDKVDEALKSGSLADASFAKLSASKKELKANRTLKKQIDALVLRLSKDDSQALAAIN